MLTNHLQYITFTGFLDKCFGFEHFITRILTKTARKSLLHVQQGSHIDFIWETAGPKIFFKVMGYLWKISRLSREAEV
jgi:hypothetical protein